MAYFWCNLNLINIVYYKVQIKNSENSQKTVRTSIYWIAIFYSWKWMEILTKSNTEKCLSWMRKKVRTCVIVHKFINFWKAIYQRRIFVTVDRLMMHLTFYYYWPYHDCYISFHWLWQYISHISTFYMKKKMSKWCDLAWKPFGMAYVNSPYSTQRVA